MADTQEDNQIIDVINSEEMDDNSQIGSMKTNNENEDDINLDNIPDDPDENQSLGQDDEPEVRPLRPIARIDSFIKNGAHIADMRWILNDTFLMIVTTTKEVLFFDALL